MPGIRADLFVLATWYSYSTAERLLALYLLVATGFLIISFLKFLGGLGFSLRGARKRLTRAVAYLRENRLSELRALGKAPASRKLEAGLEAWAVLPPESDRAAFLRIVGRANALFERTAGELEIVLGNLRHFMVLSGLLSVAWLFAEAAHQLRGLPLQKQIGIAVLFSGVGVILRGCALGLFFIAIAYVLKWHFSRRLEERRRAWEEFRAGIEQLGS
jgi:hypothetical protein